MVYTFWVCQWVFGTLLHIFFGWSFILGHGAYWWSSYLRRCPCCFGHFVLMCSLLTLLSHMDNTYFFFLLIIFGEFWHESYVSMWGHYGSRIVGVFLGPLNEVLGLISNILWGYRPSLYGGLCPICFTNKLGL